MVSKTNQPIPFLALSEKMSKLDEKLLNLIPQINSLFISSGKADPLYHTIEGVKINAFKSFIEERKKKDPTYTDTLYKLKIKFPIINFYNSWIVNERERYNLQKLQVAKKMNMLALSLYDQYPYPPRISPQDIEEMKSLNICSKRFQLPTMENPDWICMPFFGTYIPDELNDIDFYRNKISHQPYKRLELEYKTVRTNSSLEPCGILDKLKSELSEIEKDVLMGKETVLRQDHLFSKQYKIHLMPKPHLLYLCMEFLMKFISQNSDIQWHLVSIKITTNPWNSSRNPPPRIVINPKFGKYHAQIVLDCIFNRFKSRIDKFASGDIPCFNHPGKNGLIYYAQGDPNAKEKLLHKNSWLFNKIYTRDGSHFDISGRKSMFVLRTPKGY